MITNLEISRKIAEAIKTSGLKKTEIANRIGVHHSQISRYASGEKMPSIETFANLCIALDVDPADILGTNDNNFNK